MIFKSVKTRAVTGIVFLSLSSLKMNMVKITETTVPDIMNQTNMEPILSAVTVAIVSERTMERKTKTLSVKNT